MGGKEQRKKGKRIEKRGKREGKREEKRGIGVKKSEYILILLFLFNIGPYDRNKSL